MYRIVRGCKQTCNYVVLKYGKNDSAYHTSFIKSY